MNDATLSSIFAFPRQLEYDIFPPHSFLVDRLKIDSIETRLHIIKNEKNADRRAEIAEIPRTLLWLGAIKPGALTNIPNTH